MSQSIAFIGGGMSSLACASLLAAHGHKVEVFEAHTYLGGCASYFKRRDFFYDCGATTLSGLSPGRPLYQLLKTLNLLEEFLPQTLHLRKPMKIILPSKKSVYRHQDLKEFIEELKNVFPNTRHDKFWHTLQAKEQDLWPLLNLAKHFPPKSFSDVKAYLKKEVLFKSYLAKDALVPLSHIIPKDFDSELVKLIDEQLLISTQTTSAHVPILFGAMGLIYPEDMHYPFGGMKSLSDLLAKKIESEKGEFHLRHLVTQVIPQKNGSFILHAKGPGESRTEKIFDSVITSTTIWDTPKLFEGSLEEVFSKKAQGKNEGTWSALIAYAPLKPRRPIEILYQQIHHQEGSFFFSFSHPDDHSRAPKGHQTMTVSTHCKSAPFYSDIHLDKEGYLKKKETFQKQVESILLEHFELESFGKIEVGTPKTFEHYTHRFQGLVGGLPHNLKNNLLTFPTQETCLENFYQIGDTTFPGQGIVGVTTGAMILAGKILNRDFF